MNKKVKTITSWLAVTVFLFALAINVKVTLDDPFSLLSLEAIATTSSNTQILCEASVDCDSVSGDDSEVTCYGYDPMYACISYPFLFKVECDGKQHKCKIK
jgi:hypothetical protein